MKKFQFQLESALAFRRQREQTERARLEDMVSRRTLLAAERLQVDAGLNHVRQQTLGAASVASEELAALASYSRAAANQQRQIDGEIEKLSAAIERQRAVLIEAGRQTRLLEKLKQRRRADWQRQSDLVLEQEASELFLAQWVQNRD